MIGAVIRSAVDAARAGVDARSVREAFSYFVWAMRAERVIRVAEREPTSPIRRLKVRR